MIQETDNKNESPELTLEKSLLSLISKYGADKSRLMVSNLLYTYKKFREKSKSDLSLDDFLDLSPAEAQVKVDREIEYVKSSTFVYPDITADTYMPISRILEKKAGNCKEGFVLMAEILYAKGYDVFGLAVEPDNGEPGHVVCVYKDKETGKFGIAGISNEDFFPPVHENIGDIARGIAIQYKWTKAHYSKVNVDLANLLISQQPVKAEKEEAGDIDLKRDFGLQFGEMETTNGKINIEMYNDGYRVSWSGIIIQDSNEYIGTKINRIMISYEKGGKPFYVTIDSKMGPTEGCNTYLWLSPEKGCLEVREVHFHNHNAKKIAPEARLYSNAKIPPNIEESMKKLGQNIIQFLGVPAIHEVYEQKQLLDGKGLLVGKNS